ncbi:MAG TPA: hypothetical protein VF216_05405, partial [Mizugakiibacter sp.]
MIRITILDLPRAGHLDLEQDEEAQRALQDGILIIALGGHVTVEFAPGATGVWIPETGGLEMRIIDSSFPVADGEVFVSDFAARSAISTPMRGTAFALLARSGCWAQVLESPPLSREPAPTLFPGTFAAEPAAHAELVRHVRAMMQNTDPVARNRELRWIASMLRGQQSYLDDLVSLCPGRTLARRRQVFLRLQRIRQIIASDPSTETSLPRLAALANYSVSQFIAVFRRV